ncbi:VTT domain-containing protein [Candidatus Uhrbacteria bacterium]|nr:VTT domain-containing protein [Candidatus Uhrbacteria bacterium]
MLSELVHPLEQWLTDTAGKIPLEPFVILGSTIEEIIAPIPSPLVMTIAGSIALEQSRPLVSLLLISFLGMLGKLFGAWVLYAAADKLEDVLVPRFGKFFGITHQQIEELGKRFTGGWKDDLLLAFIRSLPVMPSAPVSIACGAIKMNLRTFLIGTALGTFVRNLFYLYLGYAGLSQSKQLLDGVSSIENIIQILMVLAVGLLIIWAYWRRGKS